MLRLLFLLIICISVTGCIDNAYDLTKLETDEDSQIVIGNDNSEFKMPLVTIKFSVASLNKAGQNGSVSITELMDEVHVWLPSTLPGGVDYIEIGRLMQDGVYLNSIVTALLDEMNANEQKRREVCSLIAQKYRGQVLAILDGLVSDAIITYIRNLSDEDAAEAIAKLYIQYNGIVAEAVRYIDYEFLLGLQMEDISFDIPSIDISEELYDMLVENLAPENRQKSMNGLYIYGTIESDLPISFEINPRLQGLRTELGKISVSEGVNNLNEVRLSADDLYTLTQGYGATFITSVNLGRYYINKKLSSEHTVSIKLKLRKTGGLKL